MSSLFGKIKHRTISNISKLLPEHVKALKRSLKEEKGDFKLSDLKNGATYEYGGAYALKELAKQIGLERMICSTKTPWRKIR